jgi:glycerophosphoryl diester phosphodiesterase
VEGGAEMIEFDVLRPRADFGRANEWRRAPAGPANGPGGPLLIAHDWPDAARRNPLTLGDALDAFARPPLDRIAIHCDLKIAGREDEVVDALRERELFERASVSTGHVRSLVEVRRLEPSLPLGWTLPKISRDWNALPLSKPLVLAGLASLRARLPGLVRRRAPRLGVRSIWAYHHTITPRLVTSCHAAGLELIAWTVDDVPTMRSLARIGVDGICTNDPRLFARLDGRPPTTTAS